jgi:tRNA/tmRNA/rRNA uracil-C5-methylase (TrmA/RlmC/RlmD family)
MLTVGGAGITLRRSVLAFFQGNRHLLASLVNHVVSHVPDGAALVDLYAGAGLFAIGAAAAKHARVRAVEGDRVSAADLIANAGAYESVDAGRQPVEDFVAASPKRPAVLVLAPPGPGLAREALGGVIRADTAGDLRQLRRGHACARFEAAGRGGVWDCAGEVFDTFPNTPHVETVMVFETRPETLRTAI